MKKVAFTITAALLVAGTVCAEGTSDKRKSSIIKLMDMSGAGRVDIKRNMIKAYSRVMEDVPAETWSERFTALVLCDPFASEPTGPFNCLLQLSPVHES